MRFALALTLACSAGCATIPDAGTAHLAPTENESWNAVLSECTRRDEPYDWAIRMADLRATLVTPRLRRAFIEERDALHGQFARRVAKELVALGDPDEGVDAPQKSGPDAEEQVIFFVAFYSTEQKDRDLAIKGTIWDTRLERGGHKVKPIAIEPVRMSPGVREIFPYIDRFDDLYILRFPLVDAKSGTSFLTPGGDPLRLTIKSAVASAVVEWSLVE